jgi:hypothetical protein
MPKTSNSESPTIKPSGIICGTVKLAIFGRLSNYVWQIVLCPAKISLFHPSFLDTGHEGEL